MTERTMQLQVLLWKQLLGGIDQVLITRAVFVCTKLGGFMKWELLVEHTLTTEGREEKKHINILIIFYISTILHFTYDIALLLHLSQQ